MTEFENKTFYTVRELYRFFVHNPDNSVLKKWCEVYKKSSTFDIYDKHTITRPQLENTLAKARRENKLKSLKCTNENGRLKKYLYSLEDIYDFLSAPPKKYIYLYTNE